MKRALKFLAIEFLLFLLALLLATFLGFYQPACYQLMIYRGPGVLEPPCLPKFSLGWQLIKGCGSYCLGSGEFLYLPLLIIEQLVVPYFVGSVIVWFIVANLIYRVLKRAGKGERASRVQ